MLRGLVTLILWCGSEGGAWRVRRSYELQTGSFANIPLPGSTTLPERTDMICRMVSVSDNNTIATAEFDILLVDD